ncbi:MAG: hypothetical protein HY710_01435 [Candidatus Latescibacteria bacterium]|nr:hypothetical protein [Candidatus Latescibacterota bacterium]
MTVVELTRQEIWTILCWAGAGNGEELESYNLEEASILRKLRLALAVEDARLKAQTEAVRDPDHGKTTTS